MIFVAALMLIVGGIGAGRPAESATAPDTAESAVADTQGAAEILVADTETVKENPVTVAQGETESAVAPTPEAPEHPDAAPQAANGDSLPANPAPTLSKAETLLSGMTLREKICQLFIVFPEQLTGKAPVTEAGDAMRDGLRRYPVSGIIFDRDSMKNSEQLRALVANTQSFSRIPLIITCDEEGGRVNRLMGAVGTPYVGAALSYRDKGAETAKSNAMTIAAGLTSYGFNMDLAPVADVWSNPANKVIGNRAYSTNFRQAAELVSAAVAGFHAGGVACTLKHFPGHGDTYEDSHTSSARVRRTLAQLREAEFLPFRAGIDAGADAVMVGHLIVGELDDVPATISHKIITDILRGELGFQGVVMTDSLQMEAMTEHYYPGEACVRALEAGADVLLCPNNLDAPIEALTSALNSGRLTEARIDESALRILQLKEAYGILN